MARTLNRAGGAADELQDSPLPERMESHQSLIRRMRDTIAARVENTSLRSVAREMRMSPSGLKKFLDGAAPYSPTMRRLRQWFLQYGSDQTGEVQADEAEAALKVLVHDLTGAARRDTAVSILEQLGRAYEASGKPRPAWLTEMIAAPSAAVGEEG